jgi:hypothetical protein
MGKGLTLRLSTMPAIPARHHYFSTGNAGLSRKIFFIFMQKLLDFTLSECRMSAEREVRAKARAALVLGPK